MSPSTRRLPSLPSLLVLGLGGMLLAGCGGGDGGPAEDTTRRTYADLDHDFAALNTGSMHLITSAGEDEEFVYQITKTLWEHRGDIAHPAAKSINEKNAARYTGTPFHPGAIRYYKEIGIWTEQEGAEGPAGAAKSKARTKFVDLGTAPVGGTFPIVGQDIAEVLNRNAGENGWKISAKGTKGSQENIRRITAGEMQLALSNSSISYFAVRGEGEWNEKHDIRSIATIAPNVALFITLEGTGIKQIADLKGKRVIVGPSGAGFEMFVAPILEEHGLSFDDFTKLNATQSAAVDMLGDGNADAAFLGGAVPNAAISQACASYDVYFVPFEEEARKRLIEKYPFFEDATIPEKVAGAQPKSSE